MHSNEYHRIAEKYLDDVYRTVLGCCGNKENAEDAVQNAFLKLMRETNTIFKDDEHIKRWLIKVALNECKNVWNSFWNRNKISFEELETHPSYRDETHLELLEAINKLSDNYRTVIGDYFLASTEPEPTLNLYDKIDESPFAEFKEKDGQKFLCIKDNEFATEERLFEDEKDGKADGLLENHGFEAYTLLPNGAVVNTMKTENIGFLKNFGYDSDKFWNNIYSNLDSNK